MLTTSGMFAIWNGHPKEFGWNWHFNIWLKPSGPRQGFQVKKDFAHYYPGCLLTVLLKCSNSTAAVKGIHRLALDPAVQGSRGLGMGVPRHVVWTGQGFQEEQNCMWPDPVFILCTWHYYICTASEGLEQLHLRLSSPASLKTTHNKNQYHLHAILSQNALTKHRQ